MEPAQSIATTTFDMLGALLGVLLLIVAAGWFLKRLRFTSPGLHNHLKVISVLPLSNKERVVLMQAGEEQVLMGVSTAGIQHLHTLKTPIDAQPLPKDESDPTPFAALISNLRSRTTS